MLLVILIGILPLMIQSAMSTKSGADSTQVSTMARARIEELNQLPFDADALTIAAGNELEVIDYYLQESKTWDPDNTDATDPALWERTTTIRQYSAAAMNDGEIDPGEALPAGADASTVHLKEIEVQIEGTRQGGPLGPSKRITLRLFKAK